MMNPSAVAGGFLFYFTSMLMVSESCRWGEVTFSVRVPGLLAARTMTTSWPLKKFHGGLLEALQTGGIAIANGLEGTCACNLECQLIASIGDEGSFGIGERDGDEGHIVAIGNEG